MISYTKVKGWHEIAPVMNIPCLFAVNYKDCLAYCSLEDVFLEGDIRVSPKSPNRRNPLDDQEIVFHYPTSKLKVIADGDKSKEIFDDKPSEETASGSEETKNEKEPKVSA